MYFHVLLVLRLKPLCAKNLVSTVLVFLAWDCSEKLGYERLKGQFQSCASWKLL